MTPRTVASAAAVRREVTVRGVVQGVGFRPFVYSLATGLGLAGHVANTGEGVIAEVEGPASAVEEFCVRIIADAPPLAVLESVEHRDIVAAVVTRVAGTIPSAGFKILPSRGGPAATLIPPDVATCADCLAELADPADRRYRHPFISCTNCGPRFTIVTGLPYDRAQTTMARFPMCPDCLREYDDPADRRFHAQPIACHACGPNLRLLLQSPGSAAEPTESSAADPIAEARALLDAGAILAVKGLGGYHLACDATNLDAVALLRRRKDRGDKPFALMARGLAEIERYAYPGSEEAALLTGGVRPIVLLRRRTDAPPDLAGVAPGSPDLGFMLPYTPLHHLLLGLPGDPHGPGLLVMTSANLSGEPLVTDDAEALERLAGLADAWLAHDRQIHVPCDDSVVRICDRELLTVRRSRGYAPLPITLPFTVPASLAVGGDLKNTLCLAEGRHAWLSAHIGDMDDLATQRAFERAERQLESATAVRPELLSADLHPRYRSSQWAERNRGGRPLIHVQHHHAHIASTMAEHGLDGEFKVIGIAFDGTGYGDDAAVWGGEVLVADYDGYQRFAQLDYVPLPGGDAAVERPYRMALSHLRAAGIEWSPDLACVRACPPEELRLLARQLERNLNCVPTSSMGRLFDAISSLTGVCHIAGYEAQAAIELEAAALGFAKPGRSQGESRDDTPQSVNADELRYRFALRPAEQDTYGAALIADPAPVLASVVADVRAAVETAVIAACFHDAVADLVRRVCRAARLRFGTDVVALTGGVFANTVLSAACVSTLHQDGFTVLRHHRIPPNDGGLALGQLMIAARAHRVQQTRRGQQAGQPWQPGNPGNPGQIQLPTFGDAVG